ncbi:MAG: cyclase family protein [Dehalococcoidia bacterium]|nr:cyclase family protein [Dehalococcoidia bacterium]
MTTATDIVTDYCDRFRNWGRWGEDDQRGTLNYITPEKVLEATRIPNSGRVVSLALPYDSSGPQTGAIGRVNPIHQMLITGTDYLAGVGRPGRKTPLPYGMGFSDDAVYMPLQCGTQWDSLAHVFANGKMYNGFSAGEVSSFGAARNGIENFAESLAGRGVLLDVARHKGVEALERGYAITPDDLDGAASAEGVDVREGDIVLVRTGELGRCRRDGWDGFAGGDAPGLSLHTAPWLYERRIAAIATDTWGFEVRPNEIPDSYQPLHLVAIVNMGLVVGEIFALDAIGDACAADGRYEFLFVGPPLPITGGVGSPLNALAIK